MLWILDFIFVLCTVLKQYHVHPRRTSAPVAMPTASLHSAVLDVIDKLTFGKGIQKHVIFINFVKTYKILVIKLHPQHKRGSVLNTNLLNASVTLKYIY